MNNSEKIENLKNIISSELVRIRELEEKQENAEVRLYRHQNNIKLMKIDKVTNLKQGYFGRKQSIDRKKLLVYRWTVKIIKLEK